MAGLFFCLASAEGAWLLFCPAAIQSHISVYSAFCAVNAELYSQLYKTVHGALQQLFLRFAPFYRHKYQTDTRMPLVQRWNVSQRPDALNRYQIPPPRRTLYRSAQPPIIIRYIRVQEGYAPVMNPRQTVQQIASRASPAGSRCFPRPAACNLAPVSSHGAPAGTLHPAGQSSSRGAAGGAEPLAATAASLFGLSPDS